MMHGARVASCVASALPRRRPTTFETAGQADKRRVVAMVEEACHVVEMRRLTFKETPVPAATCDVQRATCNITMRVQRTG